MLARPQRMVSSDEFRATVRGGARAAGSTIVAHVVTGPGQGSSRVGFVVSKQVGDSVTRNRVKRRLRHVAREQLGTLPAGSSLVVRALPASAEASSQVLCDELARALERVGAR